MKKANPAETPELLYGTALSMIDGVKLISDHPKVANGERNVEALIPATHMLLGFALELLLKAAARHAGEAATGHSLQDLQSQAERGGFRSVLRQVDFLVDKLEEGHSGYNYRYLKAGSQVTQLPADRSAIVLDGLADEVAAFIGIRPRADATP